MKSDPGRPQTLLAEINVTPMVDVMLVLLIVFMVSAPLMQQGIKIDLPKASTGAMQEVPEKVTLTVAANQAISLNGKPVPKGTLRTRLAAMVSVRPEMEVFVQADQSLTYGFVAQVMAEIRAASIKRVGLVTQPDPKPGRTPRL